MQHRLPGTKLTKQDNVQTNTESVQCISIPYTVYVRINKTTKT